MKNNASFVYSFFLVIGDFLALVAAFVGAYILRVTLDSRPLIEAIPARTYLGVFLALLPFWILIFALLGLYDKHIYEKRFSEVGRLFTGSFLGLLFVIGYDFVQGQTIFPARLVPLYGFGLAFIFLVIFRTMARAIRTMLFSYNIGISNLLVIGDTPITQELVTSLHDTRQSGYKILGVVGGRTQHALRHFHSFKSALEELGKTPVHAIIQTELYADEAQNQEILNYAQTKHIGYRFTPGNSELFVGNIDVELFHSAIPVITVHQTALFGWGRLVKRLFDLTVSLLAIIVLSPVFLVIMFLQLFSKGGIFFRQVRLTRFDQQFKVYKFRTLITEYNGLLPEEAFTKMGKPELIKEYRDNGDYLPHDPRYSRLGRFLYKTHLDELPQLFNIVKGDLSLVGPRALIPQELHAYAKHYTILSVKSGLTGLAQVSGRQGIGFDERRQMDMYYVQNWTFWMDIIILLKTVKLMLLGTGSK